MSLLRPLLPLALCITFTAAQAPESPPGAPTPPAAENPGEAPEPDATPATPAATPTAPAPVAPAPTPRTTPAATTPPTTRPPGAVVPGVVPPRPAGAPAVPGAVPKPAAVRDPAVPLAETKILEPIEKPTLNGAELAALYRKYTGRRVIVAAAAAAAEFSFIQDASPEDPLTYGQAAELLRKAAGIENFVFMADDKDPNLDVLTVSNRPPGIGYDVFNENDELPEGDAVITYVMTFKHIKPETASQAFTQIIGQFGTYGSIAPLNGSVVITENTSLIRRLIKLKEEIDKPDDITGTRFIPVKFADVTELSTILNELLNTQQQAQKSAAVQRAGVPNQVPGQPAQPTPGGGGGASTTIDTPVQIVPEPRTNRIFAMGRPVDLLFVEGLVREFDVETSEKTFLRRKLRFLKVAEFLPVAENALTRAFSGSGEGGSAGGVSGSNNSGGRSSSSSTGGSSRTSGFGSSSRTSGSSRSSSSNGSFGGGNSSFGGGNSSFGGGGGGGGNALGDAQVNTAPESLLVGRTLLVADNITNSIVVQGPPSGLEIVERLLDQIDVKADQVMISTVIGQLNLIDDKEFGVDYFINGSDVLTRLGGGFIAALPTDTIPGTGTGTGTTPTTNTNTFSRYSLSGGGLRAYGTAGDLSVFLKAVQSTGDFTVLARPSIFTANSQKGIISSGERIAIPTNSNSFNNGGASTNIEYQDVVLKLEVIPLINDEDTISLEIALLSDEVNGEQTIAGGGANGGDLVVPKITTREILTTVTIPNNNTIVLGGLITTRKGDNVTGIPILSSIPVLGKLFASTSKADERAELLVFIQPSIVNSRSSLDNVQSDTDSRYRITPDIRRFADGPGVLPPLEPVAPVPDKSGSSAPAARVAQPTATPTPGSPTKMKKSIRPSHKM